MTKCLIQVGDQVFPRAVLRAACSIAGVQFQQFATAEAGLAECRYSPPKAVFTQLDLPGMNGVEFLRALRDTKINRVLITPAPIAFPDFASEAWGIQKTGSSRSLSQLFDVFCEALELRLNDQQRAAFAALAGAEHDLDVLFQYLRVVDVPESWLEDLLTLAVQILPYNRRLAFLQQLLASSFAQDTSQVALQLLFDHGSAQSSFFGQILVDHSVADSLLRSCISHLADRCDDPAALAWLGPYLEDDSVLLRHEAARALYAIAKRCSHDSIDTLRDLARRSNLPFDLRTNAAQSLMILGHSPPDFVLNTVNAAVNPKLESGQSIHDQIRLRLMAIKERTATLIDESAATSRRGESLTQLSSLIESSGFRSTCLKYLRHPDPHLSGSAFTALMQREIWSLNTMEIIIDATDLPNTIRVPCVISIGQRATPRDGRRILKRILFDPKNDLQDAALSAAILAKESQHCLLRAVAQDAKLPLGLRSRALRHLCRVGKEPLIDLLYELVADSNSRMSMTACELIVSALGGQCGTFLDGQLSTLSPDHQHAGLEGALQLGPAGFMILVAFALHEGVTTDVRLRALRSLESRYTDEESSHYILKLKKQFAALRPKPKFHPPALPDSNDPSFAVTQPQRPADTIKDDPVRVFVDAEAEGAQHEEVRQKTPETKSESKRPPRRAKSRAPIRISASRVNEARQKLAAAVDLGPDGFEALQEIVYTSTFPGDARNTALRHLIHSFDASAMQAVLEYALTTGTVNMQHTALTGRFEAGERILAALQQTIEDLGNVSDIRLRALKRIQALVGRKDLLIEICEHLFADSDEELQSAALLIVFPSLRYTQSKAVESSLINLMQDHADTQVRCSAAFALGAFGAEKARKVLSAESAKLFKNPALGRAMKQALKQLGARLSET